MEMLEDFQAIRETLRDFADRHIAPYAQRIDREERIPESVVASLRDAGFFASGF